MDFVLTVVLPIAGVVLAVVAIVVSDRDRRKNGSVEEYKRNRAWQKENQPIINAAARRMHMSATEINEGMLFLSRPEWRFAEPVGLDALILNPVEAEPLGDEHFKVLKRSWPLTDNRRHMERFHQVMGEHSLPKIWFNGRSYRLMDIVSLDDGALRLDVATMSYWDGLDSWGAMSFEAARELRKWERFKQTKRYRRLLKASNALRMTRVGRRALTALNISTISGPYRRQLKNPFDLAGRNCAVGISVLTIRREGEESTFYLHERIGAAVLDGMTGCLPAGEFQPSAKYAEREDLDIWRCVMREYAEEFLELDDYLDQLSARINYDDEETPFPKLQEGLRTGAIRAYVLDIGIDPLTWKAGIRLVCIFNSGIFDQIFVKRTYKNAEGKIVVPMLAREDEPLKGWTFDDETVHRYLADATITEAMKQCLALTWQHREMLGLEQPFAA